MLACVNGRFCDFHQRIVLGGDHSISYPVLRAYEDFGPLRIVLIDAHLDYKDELMGLKYTNNSPFRRAYELPFVEQILSFGIRGIKSTDQELRESREHGNLVFSNYDVFDRGSYCCCNLREYLSLHQ